MLIVGCMLSLFSVVLFGLDGALISFEALQWVCKVSTYIPFFKLPEIAETKKTNNQPIASQCCVVKRFQAVGHCGY